MRKSPAPACLAAGTAAWLVAAADRPARADEWTAEVNLSQTSTDSETGLNHAPMARTPDGTLHVVWAEKDAPNQNYRVRTRRLAAGGWSPSEVVVDYLATDPGSNGGAKYPALAAHPDGTLHLFWHDYRISGINNLEIFTKVRPAGGPWDAGRTGELRLTTTSHPESNGDNGYVPVPASAADGTMHVAWYDFRFDGQHAEILAKTRPAAGTWDVTPGDSADVRVTSDSDNSELVAVDVDAAGNVHAAWRGVGGGARILYARRDAGPGTWSSPFVVDTQGAVAGAPALSAESSGRVHVVWPDSREGNRALWTRVRDAAGTWSAETRLTPPAFTADEPSLDAAPDGTLHLVWSDGRTSVLTPEIYHRQKAATAAWDTTSALDVAVSLSATTATRPSVHATNDEVSVLWRDARDGNQEIYFRRRTPAATATSDVVAAAPRSLHAVPNPAPDGRTRLVRADGEPTGSVTIVDARGRIVRRLFGSGGGAFWDGRSDGGAPVPAGVYFFVAPGTRAARATVLR